MMSAFAAWLAGFAKTFLSWLYNSGIDLIQGGIDGFFDFIVSVISLFPTGNAMPSLPSVPTNGVWLIFVQVLNWFLPMAFIVSAVGFVVAGMLAYIVIMPLAKWLKLVG